MSRPAPQASRAAPLDPVEAASPVAVYSALADADRTFPRLVRAVSASRRPSSLGTRTSLFLVGGRLDMDSFADEVALVAEFALARAGLVDAFSVVVEDASAHDDVGCDFCGSWSLASHRFVSFACEVARPLDAGDAADGTSLPIHLFCRADGVVFLAVLDRDDGIDWRRHSLDRESALSNDVRTTLVRMVREYVRH